AMLALRERLCEALGLPADALPFAGELLQVRDDERDWEGAIERLLHNFGLSLLVPDEHYAAVAAWVDRTHLRGRLVYYRGVGRLALVRRIAIRLGAECDGWLERGLAGRFDSACGASLEQFRGERKAIRRAGQIKTEGGRHEKDDRHALDDRTRYVLGWSNEAKIAAVAKQVADLVRRMDAGSARIAEIRKEHARFRERYGALRQLVTFADFRELDWRPLTVEIERLQVERNALEAASDVLRTLQKQLDTLEERLAALDTELQAARHERSTAVAKRETWEAQLADARTLLDATPE